MYIVSMDEAIRFDWAKANSEHIALHGVKPEEAEGDAVRVVTALDASKNEAREYLRAKGIAL